MRMKQLQIATSTMSTNNTAHRHSMLKLFFSSLLLVIFAASSGADATEALHIDAADSQFESTLKSSSGPTIDGLESEKSNFTASYTLPIAICYILVSATLVGLTGIFPLLFLPAINVTSNPESKSKTLYRLLSFAVGSMLGDVFLHLLPESWDKIHLTKDKHHNSLHNGIWILIGLVGFAILEKVLTNEELPELSEQAAKSTCSLPAPSGSNNNNNNNTPYSSLAEDASKVVNKVVNSCIADQSAPAPVAPVLPIKAVGYLNLLANCIDNFTHGLAVGASYLISQRVGMITTLAILLHEIPHEVGDFAILLKAGFSKWRAAKMQVMTAGGSIVGAVTAVLASDESTGAHVMWILPFTSGGFIYVALCTVVPDILKETNAKESLLQVVCILLAVGVMQAVSYLD